VVRAPTWSGGSVTSPLVSDPDGDPLAVSIQGADATASPPSAICAPAACSFTLQPVPVTACTLPEASLAVTAADGAASTTAALTLFRRCP
jgi:hypothetical protein